MNLFIRVCLQIVKAHCSLLSVTDALEAEAAVNMTVRLDRLLQFRQSAALPCEGLELHESTGKPHRLHDERADRERMMTHLAAILSRKGNALHCGRTSGADVAPRGRKELHCVREAFPPDAELQCKGSNAGSSTFYPEESGGLAAAIPKLGIDEVRCTFGDFHGSMQHLENSFRQVAENMS